MCVLGMYVCRGRLACVYLGMCVCVWVGERGCVFLGNVWVGVKRVTRECVCVCVCSGDDSCVCVCLGNVCGGGRGLCVICLCGFTN